LIHGNTVEQFYLATVRPKVFADRNGTIAYQELMVCVGQPIADEPGKRERMLGGLA
jgi:hypothetical protein